MYPSPQYLGETLCTLTKAQTLSLWGFVKAFKEKYVPNDEMSKKGHQNFGWNRILLFCSKWNSFLKEQSLGNLSVTIFRPPPNPRLGLRPCVCTCMLTYFISLLLHISYSSYSKIA